MLVAEGRQDSKGGRMNDRFKFRYLYQDKLREVIDLDFDNEYITVRTSPYETVSTGLELKNLMQCTGIADKNGKLIYEGDVLKIHTVWEHRPYYYAIVKWQRNRYKFQKIGKGVFLGDIAPLKDFANSEVVGNIYENPGLLEE